MSSVTARVREIRQPRGGYLNPSVFQEIRLDGGELLSAENVSPAIIGMAVDYLTRFSMGEPVEKAFEISRNGYAMRLPFVLGGHAPDVDKAFTIDALLSAIRGLDDASIVAACRAVTYDVWYRNPVQAMSAKGAGETAPDAETIRNIRVMVERSVAFWEKYGPVTCTGFTFEPGGYTSTVDAGDGDFLTRDAMWDFKVTRGKLTSKHTLQILMYWIMGQHSGQEIFRSITKLGFFNPRLNRIHLLDVSDLPSDLIRAVEKDVICYH